MKRFSNDRELSVLIVKSVIIAAIIAGILLFNVLVAQVAITQIICLVLIAVSVVNCLKLLYVFAPKTRPVLSEFVSIKFAEKYI